MGSNEAMANLNSVATVSRVFTKSLGVWQPSATFGRGADWYSPDYYDHSHSQEPTGPEEGGCRVMRGGTYLCHISYCNPYRNSARSQNPLDSSMGNTGFRSVALPGSA
jgi:sulfatase modifying factor 1